jgi:hypothetical protein
LGGSECLRQNAPALLDQRTIGDLSRAKAFQTDVLIVVPDGYIALSGRVDDPPRAVADAH